MKLEEIENKYDFTESTVHDIYWENDFKDLVLIVNYYWEYSGGGLRSVIGFWASDS